MIAFADSFLAWTAATLLSAFVGLLVISGSSRFVQAKYLCAFAFGIFLWFFVDTIGGSATLYVNSGFGGGFAQVVVVILFLVGVLIFFSIDKNRNIFSPDLAVGKYGIVIPFLVAAAVGIHGLGEGWDFGQTAYNTTNTSLLDAFGGLTAGVAYVLHKALEPMMIGACYAFYTKGVTRSSARWIRDIFLLSIIFVFTSLLGAALGYYISLDSTTYFFALGTGTSIYAAIRLVGPLFTQTQAAKSNYSIAVAVSMLLGFTAIYFAALFHS
jgi:hypothetical protein